MSYFLSQQPLRSGARIELSGEEAHHVAGTRRMKVGEAFVLQDPDGHRFRVVLEDKAGRRLLCRVGEPVPVPALPARRLTLLQGAIKPKAAEWIVQKGTELGVAAIVFAPVQHSPVSPRDLAARGLMARWERIAWEACKQCGRAAPPALHVAGDLAAALAGHAPGAPEAGGELRWLLHPAGAVPAAAALRELDPARPPPQGRLLIGPEGGLTEAEAALAAAAGFRAVHLGELVLRAETAAVTACALALYGG